MKLKLAAFVVALSVALLAHSVDAATTFKKVAFTKPIQNKSIGTLEPGVGLLVSGVFKTAPGAAVTNTVRFKAGAPIIAIYASWILMTASSPIRLVGVNIDLVDENGAVVASDTFAGTLAGSALSTLEYANLTPGATYRLVLSGSLSAAGGYSLAIESQNPT